MPTIPSLPAWSPSAGGFVDPNSLVLALDRSNAGTVKASLQELGGFVTPEYYGARANDTSARSRNVSAFNKMGRDFGKYCVISDTYYTNATIKWVDSRISMFAVPGAAQIIGNHTNGPILWWALDPNDASNGAINSRIDGVLTLDSDGNRLSAGPGKQRNHAGLGVTGFNCGFKIERDFEAIINSGNTTLQKALFRSGASPADTSTETSWLPRSFVHHTVRGLYVKNQPGCGVWVSGVEKTLIENVIIEDCGYHGFRFDGGMSDYGVLGRTRGNGIVNYLRNIAITRTGAAGFWLDNTNKAIIHGLNVSSWSAQVGQFPSSYAWPGVKINSGHSNSMVNVAVQNGPASPAGGDADYAFVADKEGANEQRLKNFSLSQLYINNTKKGFLSRGADRALYQLFEFGPDRLTSHKVNVDNSNSRVRLVNIPQHDGSNYIINPGSGNAQNFWHSDGGDVYFGQLS